MGWTTSRGAGQDIPRRITFVDEEFIGYSRTEDVTARLADFAATLCERVPGLAFEFNTRVDQIVDPARDDAWHASRWDALSAAKAAGLSRVLIGVESGSDAVLRRYVKGQTADQAAAAMRILSALGIDVRGTFITYDQLMTTDELAEQFLFLARRDAIVPPAPPDRLAAFAALRLEPAPPSAGRVYEKVPYLHNVMKVLPDSHFARQVIGAKSAEGWRGDFRSPAIAAAAAEGGRWMASANTLTMALLGPDAPRVPSPVRIAALGRIHLASFAVLGALVARSKPADASLSQSVERLTNVAFADLALCRPTPTGGWLADIANRLMEDFTRASGQAMIGSERRDAILRALS